MASQDTNTESWEPPNSCSSKTLTFKQHFFYNKKVQATAILRKIIWDMGLNCFLPLKHRHYSDNNNTWLLADSGGGGGGGSVGAELTKVDVQSVNSSFRLSLSSSATVLMVNLDNGFSENDTHAQELKWRRIESLERDIAPVANALIRFSYEQMVSATKNFSKGRVLGRGALSCVFKGKVGILRNAVAIKRLDKEDKESPKAFCRELMIASSLHNPKVVPLVGFCIDPEEGLFLVYKYVSGGSLDQHLHNRRKGMKGFPTLSWSARYKVAIGIAEAISYLHYGTEKCIVHRDIKPSNILLSSRKEPKLCDFGLATWTSAPAVPFLCRTVKGTFGYLAPEYFQHGKVSDRTDVYAFGVVLLELITGRKPIEEKRSGEENLVLWAKPLLQKGIGVAEELLDPEVRCTSRTSSQIAWMIQAADICINSEESDRPDINKILAILRGREEPLLIDCYNPSQQTKSALSSHLALAMLGVSEIDDDQYYYYR